MKEVQFLGFTNKCKNGYMLHNGDTYLHVHVKVVLRTNCDEKQQSHASALQRQRKVHILHTAARLLCKTQADQSVIGGSRQTHHSSYQSLVFPH